MDAQLVLVPTHVVRYSTRLKVLLGKSLSCLFEPMSEVFHPPFVVKNFLSLTYLDFVAVTVRQEAILRSKPKLRSLDLTTQIFGWIHCLKLDFWGSQRISLDQVSD